MDVLTFEQCQKRKTYSTDLTDEQWEFAREFLAKPTGRGAPIRVDLRRVADAIFYLTRHACTWADLPHDFPPKSTVNYHFKKWEQSGTWQRLRDALRERTRQAEGREATPSAACVDSQSVKTTELGGPSGVDGGKKVKGRKRHILVDTMGLLLAVVVTTADVPDAEGARLLFEQLSRTRFPRLEVVFADAAYNRESLAEYMGGRCWFTLEIKSKPKGMKGFVVIRKRWVVERTFGWCNRYRRLAKMYEKTIASSETVVRVATAHMMLKRNHKNSHQGPCAAVSSKAA